jgi:nitroreductase
VLVFEAFSESKEVVEHYIKARGLDELDRDFAASIRCHFHGTSAESFRQFATNQIYICLGYALAATDNLGMGACPLSGFDGKKVASVLEAAAQGGTKAGPTRLPTGSPVVMLALGSAAGDSSPLPSQSSCSSDARQSKKPKVHLSKFRLPMDELCTYYVDRA